MRIYLITAAACAAAVCTFAVTVLLAGSGMIPAWLT